MRLKRDGMLSVSAPHGIALSDVEKVIINNYDRFYMAQQELLEKNEVLNTAVADKDYIYIRGISHQFEKVSDTKFSYSIKNNKVTLYYRNLEKDYEKMIRQIAYTVFNELSAVVSEEMQLGYIEIEEKKFSGCFGKNYSKKRIALNYLLVHMDDVYIKHVLYHEYTHCLEFNHSKKFYDVLSKFDENHRKNKKYIGQNLHRFC